MENLTPEQKVVQSWKIDRRVFRSSERKVGILVADKILRYLAFVPSATIEDLVEVTGANKSTVKSAGFRLLAKGMITAKYEKVELAPFGLISRCTIKITDKGRGAVR